MLEGLAISQSLHSIQGCGKQNDEPEIGWSQSAPGRDRREITVMRSRSGPTRYPTRYPTRRSGAGQWNQGSKEWEGNSCQAVSRRTHRRRLVDLDQHATGIRLSKCVLRRSIPLCNTL